MAVRPFVVDFGTVNVKIGRVGEKIPSFVAPPLFGQPSLQNGQSDICDFSGGSPNSWLDYAVFPLNPKEKHDNTIPIAALTYENGAFKLNHDMADKLLESATSSKGVDDLMEGGTVIATEPSLHTPEFRKVLAEVLVEGQRVNKFYMCKRAALTCYASARGSGIVVDVGGSCSSVSVVSEGYVIQEAIKEEPMGGSLLDRIFLAYLNENGINIRPSFEYLKAAKTEENLKNKGQKAQNEVRAVGLRNLPYVRKEYYEYAQLYATSRVKETCCIVGEKLNVDVETTNSCFALPDGTFLDANVGTALSGIFCRCLFNDTSYLQDPKGFKVLESLNIVPGQATGDEVTLGQHLKKLSGLDALLTDSYTAASQMDPTICIPDAMSTVILSGGTTRHAAVLPLLEKRFASNNPDVEKPLFMAVGGEEQQYSSFIGASILGSLGMFESLCITREECQEHGLEHILQRKCP
ncbi:actin, putative [Babesia ovis]|uniref:Actin, putative n=1 Tax=Babesia ovis TaxID=5869 RepID=A0A9W5T9X4_BABOV|nr:actin, putative [Babesia ovis]